MQNKIASVAVFLVVFLIVYTGMHLYAYAKIRAGVELSGRGKALLWVWFVTMILAPVASRLLEEVQWHGLSTATAMVGYSWFGLLFLFIVLNFGVDVWQWLVKLWGFIASGDMTRWLPRPGVRLAVTGILAAALFVYGFIDARIIRTEHITIPSAKLNGISQPIRIAQITDVHLGNMLGDSSVQRMVDIVNGLKPDIVVSTGDLVDGNLQGKRNWATILSGIRAPLGKYAVTGNHEYYAGIDQAVAFTTKAGFEMLRDQIRQPHKALTIVGVNDLTQKRLGDGTSVAEDRLLADVNQDSFVLLLKHQPYLNDASKGWFDLQLSGHTHMGQIFPFVAMTRLVFRYTNGLYSIANNAWIYVSRGTGTWGPPIRVFAPPEITLIELAPATATALSSSAGEK